MHQPEKGLKRGLNARHIRFMALGSAIGTGLFYGSASAIQMAGPAVLLAYLIGGAAVFMVMRALGEMAVHNPVSGSFGQYASTYLGPMAGFILGWTYAFEMIIVCLADVTAFGIYMGFWFPEVARWVWVLGIVFLIGGLNLCNVKVFGEMEFWLSLLKVGAIVAMILGGFGIMLFGIHSAGETQASGLSNLWAHGGFMPNGIGGLIASFAVVMFAFGGIEIIGITAGEAKDPQRVIPKAINAVPLRILLFYVLTLFVLMAIYPWPQIGSQGSPFVQIFSNLGIGSAATILNIVVISAAVSAINSDIFGAGPHDVRPGSTRAGAQGLRAIVQTRRAVDDRCSHGRGLARRRGAQLPDPGKRIPADRLDCHLCHRVGMADDPVYPGRHAPFHDQGAGRRTEIPGAVLALCAGSGHCVHAVCVWCTRLLPGHPGGVDGGRRVDRAADHRLLAVGQACRRANGPRSITTRFCLIDNLGRR